MTEKDETQKKKEKLRKQEKKKRNNQLKLNTPPDNAYSLIVIRKRIECSAKRAIKTKKGFLEVKYTVEGLEE